MADASQRGVFCKGTLRLFLSERRGRVGTRAEGGGGTRSGAVGWAREYGVAEGHRILTPQKAGKRGTRAAPHFAQQDFKHTHTHTMFQ